jgi:MoaA/NifB/PqqE/SkfB family radical SAM enzyme
MKSTYCSAVDTGLFVSVDGDVGLCCSGNGSFGSIRSQPIQDIFKNPRFIEIKSNLESNKPDAYCQGCYRAESIAPGTSQQTAFNDQFKSTTGRNLRLADIRWSNVCNLACRYCNTHDSSQWRKLHNMPIETVNRDYTESLFEELLANKDTIECLYLLGGEPLLQKHNERLLDIVNHTVKIDMLSNLSVKLDNNKIYEKLKSFPNVYWNLSFDNVGDRFEYVRHGANWQTFIDNVDRVCDDFGQSHVTFHPVYTIWNAINLEEFYEFAAKRNFRVNWQLAIEKLDIHKGIQDLRTDSFIVFGHNKWVMERAIQEIERLNIVDPALEGIKQNLIANIDTNKSAEFLTWTGKMEQFMPPTKPFAELWPELNTLLNLP